MTRLAIAAPPPFLRNDVDQLLERVHAIGREVIAPAAVEVDRDAHGRPSSTATGGWPRSTTALHASIPG